jgi:hypothetical protein
MKLRRWAVLVVLCGLATFSPRLGHAAGVSPAKATPVQREQAQSRFLKGRTLYTAKKYDAALAELNASLDIVASPNTRLYIARCLRDMGKIVPAYVELGRAAVEANELVHEDARYEQAGAAARDERAQIEPKIGFVEVSVNHAGPDTALKVSGDEVRRGGWAEAVPVAPGEVAVVVETPGHSPVTQTVSIKAGERKSVTIDAGADNAEVATASAATVEPKSEGGLRGISRPLAFATAGVAVAGLATFIVGGILANGTYDDLERACGNRPCPPGHEGDISTGQTQQTLANVGLGVFAVFGAASATLFVISSRGKSSTPSTQARVSASPTFLSVQGTF